MMETLAELPFIGDQENSFPELRLIKRAPCRKRRRVAVLSFGNADLAIDPSSTSCDRRNSSLTSPLYRNLNVSFPARSRANRSRASPFK